MDFDALRAYWHTEEEQAHMLGWDFTHIDGRYDQPGPPWDVRTEILARLQPHHRLLDMDTGGGEFLLSLDHPYGQTAATEAFPPNVQLCREKLAPLGIDFRPARADGPLPFADASFDIVVNRHGSFNAEEIFRVLKPSGMFITQQVGGLNDHGLVELLVPGLRRQYTDFTAAVVANQFRRAGFTVEVEREAFMPCRFYETGALVWFARIIAWEFCGFSVDGCFDQLVHAQQLIDQQGYVEGVTHRFLLVARKDG